MWRVEHGQEMKMFWKCRETQWHECLALDPMVLKQGGWHGEKMETREYEWVRWHAPVHKYLTRSQWSWWRSGVEGCEHQSSGPTKVYVWKSNKCSGVFCFYLFNLQTSRLHLTLSATPVLKTGTFIWCYYSATIISFTSLILKCYFTCMSTYLLLKTPNKTLRVTDIQG